MAIVKILARHSPSYASLIRYIFDEAKMEKAEVYSNNLRSDTIQGYVREFVENEAFRKQSRSDQIYLFHEIVSFHAQENNGVITKEVIDALVGEYIRLRGHTGVMLGAAHRDKGHVHLHFCVSALQFRTGMSFGLTKPKMQELKQSFQQYHQRHFPEIERSLPNHGKGTRYVHHAKWHKEQREQIVERVQACFAHALSQKDFLERLRDEQLFHYERNGKATGIEYEGAKFRFSRLLEQDQFETLPTDPREENAALHEIQGVRERQQTMDRTERELEDRAR